MKKLIIKKMRLKKEIVKMVFLNKEYKQNES